MISKREDKKLAELGNNKQRWDWMKAGWTSTDMRVSSRTLYFLLVLMASRKSISRRFSKQFLIRKCSCHHPLGAFRNRKLLDPRIQTRSDRWDSLTGRITDVVLAGSNNSWWYSWCVSEWDVKRGLSRSETWCQTIEFGNVWQGCRGLRCVTDAPTRQNQPDGSGQKAETLSSLLRNWVWKRVLFQGIGASTRMELTWSDAWETFPYLILSYLILSYLVQHRRVYR